VLHALSALISGASVARLHQLLLRIAHGAPRERDGQHPITRPDLDDLARQATADALPAITGKIDRFGGESRSPPGPTGS
jgi:RNA polymerase sigma-70 factor (ECF subfamily)